MIIELDFKWELETATETGQAVYGPIDSWNHGVRIQYNQSVNRDHIPHTSNDPRFDQTKVQNALRKEGALNVEPDAVVAFDLKEMLKL